MSLPDFTTIVPASVYHHANYAETYSRCQQKRLSGLDFVCKFRIIDRDLMLVPNPVGSGKRKSLTRDELHALGAESAQADFWSWQIL
jgi:hypothetical protein